MWGANAVNGFINIITKDDGNRIFGRYGDFDQRMAGTVVSYQHPETDFNINLNLSGWDQNRSGVESGPDKFSIYNNVTIDMLDWFDEEINVQLSEQDREKVSELLASGISNAPGPVNDARKGSAAVVNISFKDFTLSGQQSESVKGSYYGENEFLPPLEDRWFDKEKAQTAELKWTPGFDETLGFEFTLGWFGAEKESDYFMLAPHGFWPDGDKLFIMEEPYYNSYYYKERTCYGAVEIHWGGWQGHQWLIGAEYEDAEITDGQYLSNYDPLIGNFVPEMHHIPEVEQWIAEAVNRSVFALFIQDQFSLWDRLIMTLGLRYDNYEDSEDRVTPRLAAVYKITDKHILKTQYAQAFRPPVFEETPPDASQQRSEGNSGSLPSYNNNTEGNNPELEPEIITTLETGYIYRSRYWTGRVNMFVSELRNLIGQGDDEDWTATRNRGNVVTYGAEGDVDVRFKHFFTIQGNLSYVRTDDESELTGTTRWLGNLNLIYRPFKNLSLTGRYRYIGSRYRGPEDPREELASSHTIDITAGLTDLFVTGLNLRGGIRNLFDEDIRSPSDDTGFYEDYPQPGREWWMGLTYEF